MLYGKALKEIKLSIMKKGMNGNEYYDTNEMAKAFLNSFPNQIVSKGQVIPFDFHGETLAATVMEIGLMDFESMSKKVNLPNGNS